MWAELRFNALRLGTPEAKQAEDTAAFLNEASRVGKLRFEVCCKRNTQMFAALVTADQRSQRIFEKDREAA